MRANQSEGRDERRDCGRICDSSVVVSSLESCASGPSGCIEGAVEVISDIFMSRPENDATGGSEERLGALDEVNGDGLRVRSSR